MLGVDFFPALDSTRLESREVVKAISFVTAVIHSRSGTIMYQKFTR